MTAGDRNMTHLACLELMLVLVLEHKEEEDFSKAFKVRKLSALGSFLLQYKTLHLFLAIYWKMDLVKL